MAGGTAAEKIVDLVTLTHNKYTRNRFADLGTALQSHAGVEFFINKHSLKTSAAPIMDWKIMKQYNGSAQNTKPFAVKNPTVIDLSATALSPFRHTTADFSFDTIEDELNGPPEQIIDIYKWRRGGCYGDLTDKMEADVWGLPSGPNDDSTPYGVQYAVVKNATRGFNGGAPSGFTTVYNVDLTNVPRYKNWTFTYSTPSAASLIREMKFACKNTKFKSPTREPVMPADWNYAFFTNFETSVFLSEAAEAQNTNLGSDLNKYEGMAMFYRMPFVDVPYLNADTTNPVYGINRNDFQMVISKSRNLRETRTDKTHEQHRVVTIHVDISYNSRCWSRRSNFVGYQV